MVMMMMTVMMMIGMILVVIELNGICCEYMNTCSIHVTQVKVKGWAPTNKVMKIRIL
jgi:hypothetical protein